MVNNKANIGLVDAHAEGDGGAYHVHILHQEFILYFAALATIHTGVVGQGFDAVHLQQFCNLFGFLAAEAVDDTTLAAVGFDVLNDLLSNIRFRANLVIQVGTVEGGFEQLRIQHTEVLLNVLLHLRRCSGCERHDGAIGYLLNDGAQSAILRTEVVPPFRNTVCFVDGHERDFYAAEKLDVLIFIERFRRDVEQLALSFQDVAFNLIDFCFIE